MKLKAQLDRIHSIHTRLKEADDQGFVKCVTCGKLVHWKEIQCGHYHSRSILSLRYDERNTNPQCVHCNQFKGGNLFKYSKYLIKTYGKNILDELMEKKQEHLRLRDQDYIEMIAHYKEKVKELMK